MKNLLLTILSAFSLLVVSAQQSLDFRNAEQKLNEEYCSGLFKSTDGKILDVINESGARTYLNILDWMRGRVAGLQVYTSRNGTSVPVIRGNVPGIFVDEVQVSASYLNLLSVNDIAIIKVIKTPFLGGFNSGGGAIAIYTLGDEEAEDELEK